MMTKCRTKFPSSSSCVSSKICVLSSSRQSALSFATSSFCLPFAHMKRIEPSNTEKSVMMCKIKKKREKAKQKKKWEGRKAFSLSPKNNTTRTNTHTHTLGERKGKETNAGGLRGQSSSSSKDVQGKEDRRRRKAQVRKIKTSSSCRWLSPFFFLPSLSIFLSFSLSFSQCTTPLHFVRYFLSLLSLLSLVSIFPFPPLAFIHSFKSTHAHGAHILFLLA